MPGNLRRAGPRDGPAAPAGPDELDAVVRGANYGTGGTAPVFSVPAARAASAAAPWPAAACSSARWTASGSTWSDLDGDRRRHRDPEDFLSGQYGRLRTVAARPDGALWITTSNRDGVGTPGKDDDRVLRILPPSAQSNSPL